MQRTLWWRDNGALRKHLPTVLYHGTNALCRNAIKRRSQPSLLARLGRTLRWSDIEALLVALGAEISEREGSRVGVVLFGEVRVFHRPHPSPDTDKGAITSIRKWLDENGVTP